MFYCAVFLYGEKRSSLTTRAIKWFSLCVVPVLWCSPAGISSYGHGWCKFSGAAGLNPSYQSGHRCAEARGGAAPAVGDAAGLLFCPSGERWYQIIEIYLLVKSITTLMKAGFTECAASYMVLRTCILVTKLFQAFLQVSY